MQIGIIGAGISGLYLSLNLSKKGHKVTVFEKKNKIGQEACSGLFSEKIFDFFPESRKLIKNKINYTVINFPKRKIKINFKNPFFVMSHAELDRLAVNLTEKLGTRIVLNENIDKIPQGFDRIIGADGPESFVRKSLGLKKPNYRLGILGFCSGKQGSLKMGFSENFVETWAVKNNYSKRSKYGFIWKIPKGENFEYGVLASPKYAKNIFDNFLKKNNIFLDNVKAKLIPEGFFLPKNKFITLAGDAAGLTKPWSGGGVIWQLTLADILTETFPNFLAYRRKSRKFFIPEIFFSKKITNLIFLAGFNFPYIFPRENTINSDFLFFKKNDK